MVKELITVVNGTPTVSSRDVARDFDKRHADVIVKIEGKIRPDGKREFGLLDEIGSAGNPVHQYFIRNNLKNEQNGQKYEEYLLTRDGFSLLVMGFTGQKATQWKLKYIDAFNEMETALREVDPRANILLRIYSGGQDAVIASKELAEIEAAPYLQQIAEQKPLVEFAETVSKSADNILMRNMAKLMCQQHINIGEKRLYKLLRQHDVLMSNNEPYQSYIDRGYFQVKEGSYTTPYGTTILNNTTLVTPKGQIWLVGKVREWTKTA